MGKHAKKMATIIEGVLGKWAKELMEDPKVSVVTRVKVMVPFSNALNQLKMTVSHLEREEAAKEDK